MDAFLGIATYRRPDYLRRTLEAVAAHLSGTIDYLSVVHDGPWPDVHDLHLPAGICDWKAACGLPVHGGVAAVKNELLREFLDTDAEWCFLAEDDVLPQHPDAIDGYIAAAEKSGIEHLCFHAHGPANNSPDRGTDPTGLVTYWPNWVGAWCLYSRRAVELGGFFDERFYNALEHVEHSLRLATLGFCPLPASFGVHRVADATGSEKWLQEIPGSIENSAILTEGGRAEQSKRFAAARLHWKQTRPDTYSWLWPG